MSDYQLYCFAQSGNAYRAALMLNLIGAKWKPVWVDFFAGGVQRTPQFRTEINEMGEVPVLLVDGKKRLTQSSVILTYLARQSGKYLPKGEDEELEALRWIVFDNQKTNGFLGPYRFLKNWAKPAPDQAVFNFLKGRIDGNLAIVNKRLEKRAVPARRPADHRRRLNVRLSVLSAGRVRLRYPQGSSGDFGVSRPVMKLPGWAHPTI